MSTPTCRFCSTPLGRVFVDLGMSPLSNAYLEATDLQNGETFFPLCVYVCDKCLLVQLPEYESPENIFSEYAYFTSYSDTALRHAREFTAQMVERLQLGESSRIVEIASNDGYLLQFFAQRGLEVLGIEPAANVARVAVEAGVPTEVKFFGRQTASELRQEDRLADLLIGNNVLAHVPDLNDFVGGLKILLATQGTITMEFPHLLRLIEGCQFDTIYHEHFSYLSLRTVQEVFAAHELTVFDVDQLSTHGGSLRIYAGHQNETEREQSPRIDDLLAAEKAADLDRLEGYENFAEKVQRSKRDLLSFLIRAREEGKTVAGYGAPAKGNTLLNYCGIRSDLIEYVVDRNPNKQGRYLPGTHIPIFAPEHVDQSRPDYLLILPWNLKDEIVEQMARIRTWDGRFVVPIPETTVLE